MKMSKWLIIPDQLVINTIFYPDVSSSPAYPGNLSWHPGKLKQRRHSKQTVAEIPELCLKLLIKIRNPNR